MKVIITILLILFVVLQAKLWSSDGGLKEVWKLNREVAVLKDEKQQREERNAALEAEVKDLKEGLEAIEERARSELGMIKKGETFYQLVEKQ
jgi:cell division protein FtsB